MIPFGFSFLVCTPYYARNATDYFVPETYLQLWLMSKYSYMYRMYAGYLTE